MCLGQKINSLALFCELWHSLDDNGFQTIQNGMISVFIMYLQGLECMQHALTVTYSAFVQQYMLASKIIKCII